MDQACKVILPFHYRIFECVAGRWLTFRATTVYTFASPIEPDDIARHFGLSPWDVVMELFRLNGGRDGFYLANLHDREYHYRGLEAEDVPPKLIELGLLAVDPLLKADRDD